MEGIAGALRYALHHCDIYDVDGPEGKPDGKISLVELLALEEKYRVEGENPRDNWAVNTCAEKFFEQNGGGFACVQIAPSIDEKLSADPSGAFHPEQTGP